MRTRRNVSSSEATSGGEPLLQCSHLSVDYGQGRVLNDVSLSWERPMLSAIVGASGSGKSTLLMTLAGLETPSDGIVTLLGRRVADLTADERATARLGHVGFVFQRADLVPELTVAENICLPAQLSGWGRRDVRDRLGELVSRLGLQETAHRLPSQVSGGQAQRAAVARAVMTRPKIVFADEPTGALDSVNGAAVLELLTEQVKDSGALLVMVTHDAQIAEQAERVIRLRDGQVIEDRCGPHARQLDGEHAGTNTSAGPARALA